MCFCPNWACLSHYPDFLLLHSCGARSGRSPLRPIERVPTRQFRTVFNKLDHEEAPDANSRQGWRAHQFVPRPLRVGTQLCIAIFHRVTEFGDTSWGSTLRCNSGSPLSTNLGESQPRLLRQDSDSWRVHWGVTCEVLP